MGNNSNILYSLSSSQTLKINTKTNKLISEGKDVVNLSIGESDFDTVPQASLAGIKAITEGFTNYTPTACILEIRNKICEKLKKDNDLLYTVDEVMVSNGAKQSLYNAFMAVLNPNDEIIVPVPYWPSYPEQIKLTGAKAVFIETDYDSGYKITPEQLEKEINSKTKALLINSPSNPTGAVYTEKELLELLKVNEKYDIYVICDEIYERLSYINNYKSFASLSNPRTRQKEILINGFSKAY